MALTVAPLTAAVINAVPEDRAGVASGVNNAVASLGSLLAVAILGAVALGVFDRGLDQRLAAQPVSAEVKRAVDDARGRFLIQSTVDSIRGEDRQVAESILKTSLADGLRMALLLAAALALASAVYAAFAFRSDDGKRASRA
jgi:hypothetical protein